MSYTVTPVPGIPFPPLDEWWIYDGETLIGKAYSAEKAAEFAASRDLLEAIENSMEYLESTLGHCEDDCECILHGLRAAVVKGRGQEATA